MQQTWAVVTGASSGLGVTFAQRIARQGVGVVLVARSAEPMHKLAKDLEANHGVETMVLPVDLSDRNARQALVETITDLNLSYLVNNAGFGTLGSFAAADAERMIREQELNMVAVTDLTRAVVPGMVERGRGAIINVASTAAFQPVPEMAVYAATKAFVLRFTIALWHELHPTGVRAVAVCPGPTDTGFFAEAGDDSVMSRRRNPEQVADSTFAALKRHRPYVVDGFVNSVMAFANRLAPTSLQTVLARRIATS